MKNKITKSMLVFIVLSSSINYGLSQIDSRHVGSFSWRGGLTNPGWGEFLYGTVTIGSNGRISSTYLVPRYGDRNTFSGTLNLATGTGFVDVFVNGNPSTKRVRIKLRSRSQICFDGTFSNPDNGGVGIISGIR